MCIMMHDIQTKKGISVYGLKSKGPSVDMNKKCTAITSSLVRHMDSRYNDFKNDVIEATRVANIKSWPCQNDAGTGINI